MFVSFEGIDGSGKSTQCRLFCEYLEKRNIDYIFVREPGGTDLSEKIRELLLSNNHSMSAVSELMLFEAARANLVENVIRPALRNGKWVISDRFCDSTTVYQGYGRGLNIEKVKDINLFTTGGLEPGITVYLDVSLELAANRTKNNNKDRIENSGREFFELIVNGYRELCKTEERITIVNSNGSIEETQELIIKVFKQKGYL